MEIRVLRYFPEIAREENMTRAAERLHVSQPSLSRQMKDLEAVRRTGGPAADHGSLSFRPIIPALHTKLYVIWKKYQVFTPATRGLPDELKEILY